MSQGGVGRVAVAQLRARCAGPGCVAWCAFERVQEEVDLCLAWGGAEMVQTDRYCGHQLVAAGVQGGKQRAKQAFALPGDQAPWRTSQTPCGKRQLPDAKPPSRSRPAIAPYR